MDAMPNSRRINLDLRPEAMKAVENLNEKRGHNITEAVNKSLVLYDTLLDYIATGGEIHIVYENSNNVIVKIL